MTDDPLASPSPDPAGSAGPSEDSLVEVGSRATLTDAIDRLLNRGAVVAGDVVISVANVDLVYLNLRVLLTSVETLQESRATGTPGGDAGGSARTDEGTR